MSATWPDLTDKLDPIHRRALRAVAAAARVAGIDWFVTGAMARDWIFTAMHGIRMPRSTTDADIGIAIAGWDEFDRIHNGLIEAGDFVASRSPHRLDYRPMQEFHVDLVPFGAVGGGKAEIAWPPGHDVVMNVIGFEEAFRAAMTVLADAGLPVKVASPAGLMLMKVFAWEDRKHAPGLKDAIDMRCLLTLYENIAGRSLWDAEGLMEMEDHDAARAAARLLGRDVGSILSPTSRSSLLPVLDRELVADAGSLLLEQLARGQAAARISADEDFRKMRSLLTSFRSGLDD